MDTHLKIERRIPLRELRAMRAKLEAMSARIHECYPNAYSGERQTCRDPLAETSRNIDTATAEIRGWIAAREQGLRQDPGEAV